MVALAIVWRDGLAAGMVMSEGGEAVRRALPNIMEGFALGLVIALIGVVILKATKPVPKS